jgi:hypothetical protein
MVKINVIICLYISLFSVGERIICEPMNFDPSVSALTCQVQFMWRQDESAKKHPPRLATRSFKAQAKHKDVTTLKIHIDVGHPLFVDCFPKETMGFPHLLFT